MNECSQHPRTEFTECHHLGNRFVAFYAGGGWVIYGLGDDRGDTDAICEPLALMPRELLLDWLRS